MRLRSSTLSILAFLGLSSWAVQSTVGQTVEANRTDIARNQAAPFGTGVSAEGIEDGHAASSPNDADLGEQEILKRVERYQPFTASVALPIYWTSNVALARSGEVDDVIEAPVAGIFYEPRITKTLYGLADVREQLFYYDEYDSFNFGAFDVDLGFTYFVPKLNNLILRLVYNYDRLTMKDSFDAFFENHALIFNAELPIRIGRAQQVSLGTTVNVSMTAEPEAPRRNDYDFYVGYSANLTRSFNINAVGRIAVRDYYHQNSRVDVSEILALTATYRVTKCLSASAISTFAASQSNHNVFDYEVANVGGALSLSVKF